MGSRNGDDMVVYLRKPRGERPRERQFPLAVVRQRANDD